MYKVIDPVTAFSDLELALLVLLNCYGSGAKRKAALGPRYVKVQGIVNQITSSGYVTALDSGSITAEKVRDVLEAWRPTVSDYDEFMDEFLNALKEAR